MPRGPCAPLHQVAEQHAQVVAAAESQAADEAGNILDGAEQTDEGAKQAQANQRAADEGGHRHDRKQALFGDIEFSAQCFLVIVGDAVATAREQVVDAGNSGLPVQDRPERLARSLVAAIPGRDPAQFAGDVPGGAQREQQTDGHR